MDSKEFARINEIFTDLPQNIFCAKVFIIELPDLSYLVYDVDVDHVFSYANKSQALKYLDDKDNKIHFSLSKLSKHSINIFQNLKNNHKLNEIIKYNNVSKLYQILALYARIDSPTNKYQIFDK